jgi:hypothetical protein
MNKIKIYAQAKINVVFEFSCCYENNDHHCEIKLLLASGEKHGITYFEKDFNNSVLACELSKTIVSEFGKAQEFVVLAKYKDEKVIITFIDDFNVVIKSDPFLDDSNKPLEFFIRLVLCFSDLFHIINMKAEYPQQ